MTLTLPLTLLALLAAILIARLALRPDAVTERGGRILAFAALFAFPVLFTGLGTQAHLQHSKTTHFCMSCHIMSEHGRSLFRDDSDYLPAAHFQNNRIDRDYACYTCHTTYTMYGDVKAKLIGLRHVWVNYLGTLPEQVELYQPYKNRECLHCHEGARSFEEDELHAEIRGELSSNETSCLECHDLAHDVEELDEAEFWEATLR